MTLTGSPNRKLSAEEMKDLERAGREADVKVVLLKLGVRRSQIMEIVKLYSLERIERQLRWLPYRKARKVSSLIVAAIKEDYEEPSAALEQTTTSNSSSDLENQLKEEAHD